MTVIIALAGGICVAALLLAVATVFRNPVDTAMHDRLDVLAGKKKSQAMEDTSVLSRPLDDMPNALEEFVSNFFNVRRLLQQANVDMKTEKFISLCLACAGFGLLIALATRLHVALYLALPVAPVSASIRLGMHEAKKTNEIVHQAVAGSFGHVGTRAQSWP